MPERAGNTPPVTPSGREGPAPDQKIDAEEIAEKVYRLMRNDLLVENDRTKGLRG